MKSRPMFKLSEETAKIHQFFGLLPLDRPTSFEELSKAVSFPVKSTTPAYQYARRKFVQSGTGVIEAIRGFGFTRLPADQIVKTGARGLKKIRRASRFEGKKQEIAIGQNLGREEMVEATYFLARFRLLSDNSSAPRSNRTVHEEPPQI